MKQERVAEKGEREEKEVEVKRKGERWKNGERGDECEKMVQKCTRVSGGSA